MSAENSTKTNQESLCMFNEEFIQILNQLKQKKRKLIKKITKERMDINNIQKTLDENNNNKSALEASLLKKEKQLETIDSTITNTQTAYEKIVETSQVLLTVIKKQKRDTKE
jgi:Sjoegren syndrome nuclear autoantigen 1